MTSNIPLPSGPSPRLATTSRDTTRSSSLIAERRSPPTKRQTLINGLLIIAGIVLAVALFAAGVLWHSRTGS